MKQFCKNFIVFVLICILSCSTLLVSCNGKIQDNGTVKNPQDSITLETTQKVLVIDESFYLKVTDYTYQNDAEFVFESSNTSVAIVDSEGLVKGLTVGTSDITVTYGDESAVCKITVALAEKLPVIAFNAVANSQTVQEIYEGDKLDLSCYVKYNQINYNDASFTYSLSDTSAGTISDGGIFTANTLPSGTESKDVTVFITASWRNAESETLTEYVKINVKKAYTYLDRQITVNGLRATKLTVNTCETVDWYEEETFTNQVDFVMKGFGQDADGTIVDLTNDVLVEVVEGEDKIRIEDNSVIGQKGGLAVIRLTLPSATEGLPAYVMEVEVEVVKPIIPYHSVLGSVSDPLSYAEGVDLSSLGFKSIEYAVQEDGTENANALTIDGMNVFGVQTERATLTQTVLTVGNETYLVQLPTVGYTRILNDEKELYDTLVLSTNSTQVDGYYFVGNDIEDSSETPASDGRSSHSVISNNASTNGVGFIGTFDGNGKIVKYNNRAWGLFGNVGTTAVIKNVAFILNSLYNGIHWNQTNYPGMSLLANNSPRGSWENVYFSINPDFGDIQDVYLGVNLFNSLTASAKIKLKNVVFDLPECYTLSDLSWNDSYVGSAYSKENKIYFKTAPATLQTSRYTGLLIGNCTLESEKMDGMFENVYIVNRTSGQANYLSYTATFDANNQMLSFRKYFAENDTQALEAARTSDASLGVENRYYGTIKGIKCYNSHEAIKTALGVNTDLIIGGWKINDICNVNWQGE